jgi:hypothetical protein
MSKSLYLMLLTGLVVNPAALADSDVRINFYNLLEEQVGNLPDTDPVDLASTYNQLNLGLIYRDIELGLRGEFFNSSYPQDGYAAFPFTQRYARWHGDGWEATAGNFYAILGRGLTFRAFELSGVINEDHSYRRRYALSRDVDGVYFRGGPDRAEVTLLHGRPLVNDFPPGNGDLNQRGPEVTGGQIKLRLNSSLSAGATHLSRYRFENDLSSVFVEFNPAPILERLGLGALFVDFYGERAVAGRDIASPLGSSDARASYMMSNIIYGDFGLSVEYKDYRNFLLGINDPPSLIRENYWTLLNRSTHVLRADGETGWQFELLYNLPGDHLLTANYSTAKVDDLLGAQRYYQYFAQLDVRHHDRLSARYFVDFGEDISRQEVDRITLGVSSEIIWTDTRSLRLEYQWQRLDRMFSVRRPRFSNNLVSASLYVAPHFSLGIIMERSTDFTETDNPDTAAEELAAAWWVGGFLGYHFLDRFDINLFAGTRRGGPACTAGTCYEKLPFRGMEVRLSSRI